MRIIQAATAEQLAQEKELILEYAAWLNFDLSFQGFAKEMDNLLGKYGPPGGRLLLALVGAHPAGCGALHALDGDTCEMNRVYVRPDFRGKGIGRRLVETLIAEARTIGYRRIRLESGDWMLTALALYRDLGFEQIAPYVSVDLGPHVIFMELGLIPTPTPARGPSRVVNSPGLLPLYATARRLCGVASRTGTGGTRWYRK